MNLFHIFSAIIALFAFWAIPVSAQNLPLGDLKAGLRQLPFDLPHMIDEETRLDRVEGGHNEVVYFNTLINYTYDQFPDPQLLMDGIAPAIIQNYCTGPTMAPFRDAGISLLHFYYDKDAELIGTIKTDLSHCE